VHTKGVKVVKQQAAVFKQQGQALLLILVLTAITALLGIAVLSNALLISEKMELQNTADAAAYSVSTAEARDLNFASYTNRAMVANEVAIGQVLSLMSWATMVEKTGPTLALYLSPLIAILHTPPVTAVGQAVASFFRAFSRFGAKLGKGMAQITKPVAQALAFINLAYSTSQRAFNIATFALSVTILYDILDNNDIENYTNAPKPQFSVFGLLALAGHFVTHYPDLGMLAPNGPMITSYKQDTDARSITHFNPKMKPTAPEQKAGMERFASMVNKNRDRYTKDRAGGWSFELRPPIFPAVGVDVCVCTPEIPTPLGTIPAFKAFEFKVGLDVYLNRRGGAEVRFKKKGSGASTTQNYSWSAVDTNTVDFNPVIRLTILNVSQSIEFPGLGVPVGVGATQAATPDAALGSTALFPVGDMRYQKYFSSGDLVSPNNYGTSPGTSFLTWASGWQEIPSVPYGEGKLTTRGPSQTVDSYNWVESYRLPRYNDTKTTVAPISIVGKTLGFESPYLIIGLYKKSDELSDPAAPRPIGRMAPATGHADGEVAVIAKSQVYFSRPTDVDYLWRADKLTEYASAFNPYWSARLVDTSILDRVMALSLQQKQFFLPSDADVIIDDFIDILQWMQS
jgi:hypothetical protein